MAREKPIRTAVGMELVRELAGSGKRLFTAEEARKVGPSLGISPGYLRQALHHLARTGWIVRLKKGLYSLSGSVPGVTPAHEFEIAMALVKPAAISHWSALNFHGLTEQAPRRVFVLTSARSVPRVRGAKPDRPGEGYLVGGIPYQFVQVKPERFFGIEDVWVHEARIKMTDPERTLLDGLMTPHYCGDFAEVLHAFDVGSPKLDVDRIVRYALKLEAATAKRLGWILEQLGIKGNQLEPLRRVPIKGYRALDPSGPRQGPCDAAWMVQVNRPGRVRP